MGLVDRLIGAGESPADTATAMDEHSLTDGALDTLSCLLRTMGEASFPTDKDINLDTFLAECAAYARHVEHGAAIPDADVPQSTDGRRDWSQVRRFFVDRRYSERDFVTDRLGEYRDVVEDLVAGLRQIGERDQTTESSIIECLERIQEAVQRGGLPDTKAAVSEAIDRVNDTFSQQRLAYERQIEELNTRLSTLRQDLVAAREEMQRDALTDVFNRGAFDQGLEQSINMHYIGNQPVTLALIDLDHFKYVNDSHGHAAGDAVLRAVAEALSRSFIRKSDFVARYGGDEFALILNDTAAASTEPLLQRFLDSLRNVEIADSRQAIPITCSIGYTEITNSDDATSVIKRADRGLYLAKAAGRNCARFVPTDAISDEEQ